MRKTAAMAVAKIYHVSPEHVADLTETLYTMIKDRSPMVCANQFPMYRQRHKKHAHTCTHKFAAIFLNVVCNAMVT